VIARGTDDELFINESHKGANCKSLELGTEKSMS
jgi:hypothetical protein